MQYLTSKLAILITATILLSAASVHALWFDPFNTINTWYSPNTALPFGNNVGKVGIEPVFGDPALLMLSDSTVGSLATTETMLARQRITLDGSKPSAFVKFKHVHSALSAGGNYPLFRKQVTFYAYDHFGLLVGVDPVEITNGDASTLNATGDRSTWADFSRSVSFGGREFNTLIIEISLTVLGNDWSTSKSWHIDNLTVNEGLSNSGGPAPLPTP